MREDTPFLRFWSALNDHRKVTGHQEVPYGIARDAWQQVLDDVRRDMLNHQLRYGLAS